MLSYTQISTYLQCPWRYYLKYIEHIPEPRRKQLYFGSSIHEALNFHYVAKNKQKTLEVFESVFEEQAQEEGSEKIEEKEKQELKKLGKDMLINYLPKFEQLDIADMEKEIIFDIDGIEMIGYLDYILREGVIMDIKTSTRRWKPEDVKDSLQMRLYTLAYREYYGEKEKGVRIDVLLKNKKRENDSLVVWLKEGELDMARRIVYGVANAIDKHIFYPCNPSSWQCRSCPYRKICEEGGKKSVSKIVL